MASSVRNKKTLRQTVVLYAIAIGIMVVYLAIGTAFWYLIHR